MIVGLNIIAHALRMLLHDPAATLRVILPGLILSVGSAVISYILLGDNMRLLLAGDQTALERITVGTAFAALALIVLQMLGYVLIAICWHRYVLMNDPETDAKVRPAPRTMARYIWRAFLVGLAQVLILIPLGLFAGFAGAAIGSATVILPLLLGLFINIAALWFALRISITLPAAAVDDRMTLAESWSVSAPAAGDIFWVAVLLSLINLGVVTLMQVIFTGPSVVTVGVETLVFLAEALVAISVLTTLYGHLVERRPLR